MQHLPSEGTRSQAALQHDWSAPRHQELAYKRARAQAKLCVGLHHAVHLIALLQVCHCLRFVCEDVFTFHTRELQCTFKCKYSVKKTRQVRARTHARTHACMNHKKEREQREHLSLGELQ